MDAGARVRTSFLVPVYNRQDMLSDALNSIWRQTDADWECVIVDGASTDQTAKVAYAFADADSRFKVVVEEANTGALGGYIRCLEEARGTYGKFVYSDDTVYPAFLERTIPLMEEDTAFVFTTAAVGPQPDSVDFLMYQNNPLHFAASVFIERMLRWDGSLPVSPGAGLFRLADLKKNQLSAEEAPHQLAGTDLLQYLWAAEEYPVVRCIHDPLVFFRLHPGSCTVMNGDAVAEGYAVTLQWYQEGRRL